MRCTKSASFFSSPACVSLLIRQKDVFISAPRVTASAEQNQNGIRIPGRKFPRGRLKHPTRAPASRRLPAGFHAGACNLSGMRVDFCSKSADFHARVPEVDSLHSHGFIMMKFHLTSKLYPEMQKHSKTRQKHKILEFKTSIQAIIRRSKWYKMPLITPPNLNRCLSSSSTDAK